MIKLTNGSIVFDKKGPIPPEQEGYMRNPNDPYHFLPILKPCVYREVIERRKPGCGHCYKRETYCSFFEKKIEVAKCLTCAEIKSE